MRFFVFFRDVPANLGFQFAVPRLEVEPLFREKRTRALRELAVRLSEAVTLPVVWQNGVHAEFGFPQLGDRNRVLGPKRRGIDVVGSGLEEPAKRSDAVRGGHRAWRNTEGIATRAQLVARLRDRRRLRGRLPVLAPRPRHGRLGGVRPLEVVLVPARHPVLRVREARARRRATHGRPTGLDRTLVTVRVRVFFFVFPVRPL
mmetsp:Transcript_1383/g.5669  ORF Transcript_1383/g.5669 Transcript_1383/m.5669 type:complete len:202 (-) Transcript_1383:831-1436(-)